MTTELNQSNNVRVLEGVVISNKMKDTITVLINRRVKHPKYGKYIRRSLKLHAHDSGNTCKMGDIVLVRESRPISKTKCWMLVSIKERAV